MQRAQLHLIAVHTGHHLCMQSISASPQSHLQALVAWPFTSTRMGLINRLLAVLVLQLCISEVLCARLVDQGLHMQAGSSKKVAYTPEAEKDRVSSLPGWGSIKGFDMFSGYVTVNEEAGRQLFYAYTSSSVSPEEQPLLLWLNGGPGCSSIGGGFMSELGPFLPVPGKKLQANPDSWNQVANVLFVESPAFVGFSTSNDPGDARVGDERTAADMRLFLLGFIQRFPHLASKELYISGESYAGHYLPTLAWEIVKGNKAAQAAAPSQPTPPGWLNFKGVLLGNPWTDAAMDNLGAVDFWWAHALISDSSALGIKSNCDFSRIGPLDAHPADSDAHTRAGACDKFCNMAAVEMGPINIYHIYADVCLPPAARRALAAMQAALEQEQAGTTPAPVMLGLKAATTSLSKLQQLAHRRRNAAATPDEPVYDPCIDDEVETYLNMPEVQHALHANISGAIPGRWSDCTNKISYSREDMMVSMLPVWNKLINTEGLRFLVYSGDVDGIVPVVGTRRWVASLNLAEAACWQPWTNPAQGQVGGYSVSYYLPWQKPGGGNKGGMTFASVRGAGHMVPYTQPARGLYLASRFLQGKSL